MNLERMKQVADSYNKTSPEIQILHHHAVETVLDHMETTLPAFNEMDKSAAAWLVAEVLTALREIPLYDVSETVTETAIGYSLAACKLIGMIP